MIVIVTVVVIVTSFNKNNLTPQQPMRFSQGSFCDSRNVWHPDTWQKNDQHMAAWMKEKNHQHGLLCVKFLIKESMFYQCKYYDFFSYKLHSSWSRHTIVPTCFITVRRLDWCHHQVLYPGSSYIQLHWWKPRCICIIHYEILGSYLQKPLQHHDFGALFQADPQVVTGK